VTALEAGAYPSRSPADDDAEHLRLLAVFHYAVAGITALVSMLPGIGVVAGLALAIGGVEPQEEGARIAGALMAGCAAFFLTVGLAFAGLIALTGRALAQRRWYTFCLVVATTMCIAVPLGTVLGVFTIIVLSRPSVRATFERSGGAVAVRS
jgi:hypothetical protein